MERYPRRSMVSAIVLFVWSFAAILAPAPVFTAPSPEVDHPSTNIGGPILTDTTWTAANSPYIATGNVLVMENVTLTIEPGVTILFDQDKALQVSGTLVARGTSDKPIRFTSNQSDPMAGDWRYLHFDSKSRSTTYNEAGEYTGGSILQYVTVEYAGSNDPAAIRIEDTAVWVDHATVRHNGKGGVSVQGSLARVTNSTIHNNNGSGIAVWNSEIAGGSTGAALVAEGNRIANNRGGTILPMDSIFPPRGGGIFADVCATHIKITNNVIEYNSVEGYGAGLYLVDPCVGGGPHVVKGNTIRHNNTWYYDQGVDGGIFFQAGNAILNDNIVYRNESARGCAGIALLSGGDITLTNNIIFRNRSTDQHQPVGGLCDKGQNSTYKVKIIDNIIAGNFGSGSPSSAGTGGILTQGAPTQIHNNSIVFNHVSSGRAGAALDAYYSNPVGETSYVSNTFVGNTTNGQADQFNTAFCLACEARTTFEYTFTLHFNNLWSNDTLYTLTNQRAQGTAAIDATQNWWGIADPNMIFAQIYDFFDDAQLGTVDYGNYLHQPNTDAPISPPQNLKVTVEDGKFKLTWDANPETDLAGYRVYYAGSTFPYAGSGATEGNSGIDVGKVTVFTLSGLPADKKHFFTVTAYDDDGDESWFAVEAQAAIGKLQLENGDFERGPVGVWNEHDLNQIRASGQLLKDIPPHSGDFLAILGANAFTEATLSQVVYIDPNYTQLQYHYLIYQTDYVTHKICDPEIAPKGVYVMGSAVATHPPCGDSDRWQMQEVDLSSYAGQVVELAFYNNNLSGNALLLDDVGFVSGGSQPGPQGSLQVAPLSITFAADAANNPPADQSFTITNKSSGALAWTATETLPWLSLSANSGSAPATVEVSANPASLSPGVYSGAITISSAGAAGSPAIVNVTLTIAGGDEPTLGVSPATLAFQVDASGKASTLDLEILNLGSGALPWTATESLPWLSLSATSGTGPMTVQATVDTSGMTLGTYSGQIVVTSPGTAGSPQIVNVSLVIGANNGAGHSSYLPGITK